MFDFLEPVRRVTERCDNASVRGEQVRHMERVIIDGHGLADQTVLVIEAIESGRGRNECDTGIDRVHHKSPWQAELLVRRNLMIWNAEIYSALVVQDTAVVGVH